MTDLEKLYFHARQRDGGRGHHAALRQVARDTGIDKDTIDRCLKRARRTDAIEAKRARVAA